MAESLDYSIENVGGIQRAALQLRRGVNVLRGKNASGKTIAMKAVVRAADGEGELERRDGTDHGEVRGPGVHLVVGKVVKKTGEAEIVIADSAPLSRLIDPNLKDTDAAARARIRALVDLLGLGVDDASLEVLCGGDEFLLAWLRKHVQEESINELLGAAEALRNHAHALARVYEADAENATGRAQAALSRCESIAKALDGDGNLVNERVEDAQRALAVAGRSYERSVAQCDARLALEAQQAEIRETLGERPDASIALEQLQHAQAATIEADEECRRLAEQLAAARERHASAKALYERAHGEANAIALRAGKWDEAQKVLDRAPEGPTPDDLAKIEAEQIGAATARLTAAQLSQDFREAEAAHREAEADRARAEHDGKKLRKAAEALPERLGRILSGAGAKGLTVVGGRLVAIDAEGKFQDFERRLSAGERVKAALDVAAERFAGQVVAVSDTYWMRLDPENQAAFAALARERGLYVLTEAPAMGSLRVEHVGDVAGDAA